jgi:hypothetical protein
MTNEQQAEGWTEERTRVALLRHVQACIESFTLDDVRAVDALVLRFELLRAAGRTGTLTLTEIANQFRLAYEDIEHIQRARAADAVIDAIGGGS